MIENDGTPFTDALRKHLSKGNYENSTAIALKHGEELERELRTAEAVLAEARKTERERCAKVCDERAETMNRLGSDAKMEKTLSHAAIQAERVWEEKHIAAAIRALSDEQAIEKEQS